MSREFIFNHTFSGDLYFEKAVDGFLSDMFDKWKQYGSSHEVQRAPTFLTMFQSFFFFQIEWLLQSYRYSSEFENLFYLGNHRSLLPLFLRCYGSLPISGEDSRLPASRLQRQVLRGLLQSCCTGEPKLENLKSLLKVKEPKEWSLGFWFIQIKKTVSAQISHY
jgi:hypothetical protein